MSADLLEEIRDLLSPPEMPDDERCPSCGSSEASKELHRDGRLCGEGPCIRASPKGDHVLVDCQECGASWVI